MPSRQQSDNLLCYPRRVAEPVRDFREVRAPHYPWECGNNENTNGRLRELFPKCRDITDMPEDYIQRKYHELNLRYGKCLGYKTPYEVYFKGVVLGLKNCPLFIDYFIT